MNQSTILLSTLINDVEFRTKAINWVYMKLQEVTVSLYPDQKATVTQWLMLWTNDDNTSDNVALSDSNKIMTTNTLRTQHRKWRVPNAVLPIGLDLVGLTSVNLKDWIVIDDIGTFNPSENLMNYFLPGRLVMSKSDTEFTRFRVTMKIQFRNAKYPTVQGLISSLMSRNVNKEEKRLLRVLADQHPISERKCVQQLLPFEWKIIKEINKEIDERNEDEANDALYEQEKKEWFDEEN